MDQATANPLGREPIPQLLRGFAVPSIIAMLVSSLYNVVDQVFIGWGVGYLGNAATNVAYPLTTICLAIALLLSAGSASRFSLHLGRGEADKAAGIAGSAVTMAAVFGIAYAAAIEVWLPGLLRLFGSTPEVFPYAQSYTRITALGLPFFIVTKVVSTLARADGSPRYSMLCIAAGAVLNTILDPIFIFVLKMGVAGAAIATVAGQLFSLLLSLAYIPRFRNVRLERRHYRVDLYNAVTVMTYGMSNSFNQVAITLVQIVLNNSLVYYGALSPYGKEIPLAASGIVIKINALLLGVIIGISQGAQPIIGFNYGAGQYRRVRDTFWLAIRWNLLVSAAGFLLFQLCPRLLLACFGTGSELYYRFGVRFMRIFLLMVVINGVQLLSSKFFAAIGKPLKGLFLSMTRQVIFLMPLLVALPLIWGLDGIMYAAPTADLAAFVVTLLFVLAEFRRMPAADRQENPAL